MTEKQQDLFTFNKCEPINDCPELRWAGKRPFTGISYYPAQLKETYGSETEGWMNKLYCGDNIQVMSHMLKEFRGKVDLIYIDPPFNSKADYKKTISLRGKKNESKEQKSNSSTFEEKQYGDIWTSNEYLQFMYERLILCRELLSDTGSIYLHCDWHRSHYLRGIMDEVFGYGNFINEIVWCYTGPGYWKDKFVRKHDNIFLYSKSDSHTFVPQFIAYKTGIHVNKTGIVTTYGGGTKESNSAELEARGKPVEDYWNDIYTVDRVRSEMVDYPTQKPEALLERIIKASSNPGDIVFDCFMGAGTTQAVAMKLGRRFIGADINMGAIQTTTKRLISRAKELNGQITSEKCYTGFEVYNVNEFFRNELNKCTESLELNTELEIDELLRDKKDICFKRELDALVQIVSRQNKRFIEIQSFYSTKLLQKLHIEYQDIEDWRDFVDSVLIDWNYDEVIFRPTTLDIPDKKPLVAGNYEVPESTGCIHVKITDLLGDSWEGTIESE